MKKIVLVVLATMVMTACFAETEEKNAVIQNVENYDMSFDMRRLAVTLDLTMDQMEVVNNIQNSFNDKMHSAATAGIMERASLVDQAVKEDVQNMYYVLNDKQFNTYVDLLNVTLRNKGLR